MFSAFVGVVCYLLAQRSAFFVRVVWFLLSQELSVVHFPRGCLLAASVGGYLFSAFPRAVCFPLHKS